MKELILKLLANKHTSGAAVIAAIASGLEFLGPLWFPNKAHQFSETGRWLARMAVMYGLVMAGDAGQGASKQDVQQAKQDVAEAMKSGDTTHLTKQDASDTKAA